MGPGFRGALQAGRFAELGGRTVEPVAVLDRADADTRAIFMHFVADFKLIELTICNLAVSRNAGAPVASR